MATTLTSEDLKPGEDLSQQVETTEEPSIPPIELTETETEVQDKIEKATELETEAAGEAAFRTQQVQEQGIPEIEAQQRDLESQLRGLQEESRAIPLQIQEEFEGRGATRGGVAPIETARLRRNAIKALTVSALLDASRGKLATAQDKVERAVEAKFEPIKAELRATKNNLQLIMNSPEATVEEKRRAEQRQAEITKREKEVAEEEAQESSIQEVAIAAAQAGVDALTIKKIQEAESVVEANRIAAEAGVFREEEKQKDLDVTVDGEGIVYKFTNEQGQTFKSEDRFNQETVPTELRSMIVGDITFGASVDELIQAYPEVDDDYLISLFDKLR